MEDIIASLNEKINELNTRKLFFVINTNRINDCNNRQLIISHLKSTKRAFFLYLILSIILGGILYIAGFAQLLEWNFLNLSRAGLLIIMTFGMIGQAWNQRMDIERFKTILFLLDIKETLNNK